MLADEAVAIEQILDELSRRRSQASSRFELRWAAFTAASTVTRIEDDFRLMPPGDVSIAPLSLPVSVH
jgi:hypothetical protein